jgi:hypothetical protein
MPIEAAVAKDMTSQDVNAASAPASAPVRNVPNKRVFNAAVNSAEFFDHLRAHFRETRRTRVDIDCDIQLVLVDGSLFDAGTANIRDFSPSGALIGNMKLPKGCYPAAPFKVLITLKGGDYNGICIEATPVRLAMDMPGLGVRFDEIVVRV